jgi:hypothetical protein
MAVAHIVAQFYRTLWKSIDIYSESIGRNLQ